MSTVNEARRVWEETRAGFEPVRILYKGKMGKGDGTVEDASRPNYVWVRIGNQTAYAVFNVRVAPYNDLPVLIGRTPDLPDTDQILGVDWGEWLDKWTSPFLPRHGITHAWNGADPTWIDKRAITSLLVRATDPASMRVIILGTERYPWGTGWHEFYTSLSDDLTSRIPAGAGEHRLVLISIDAASNSLQYTNGAAVPEAMIATAPTPPAGCIPLACVELTNGMSTITQDEITDYRIMWDTVADGASPWGNVIVVAKSGGDYDNLPDAVAAASDGDAIVMMEGVYNDAVTIDKKLLIRAGGTPLSTFLDSSVGRVEISGDVTITEACQLRGIAVSGAFTVNVGAYQKWIGAEHCSFDTTTFASAGGSQVWIKLVDCYVDGEIGLDFSEATDGEVHIYGCENENGSTFPLDHGAADLYIGWSAYSTPLTGTGARYFVDANPILEALKTVDGTGSGLDADLLDSYEASAFPRKAEDAAIAGAWTHNDDISMAAGKTVDGLDLDELGKMLFTTADGLLLLDMQRVVKEGSTNYVIGSRGEKATLSGALHVAQGRWAGKQGVVVEKGTTNECKNPSFETNATYWASASAGTVTRTSAESRRGSYSLLCESGGGQTYVQAQYTGGVTSFDASKDYAISFDYMVDDLPGGGDIQILAYWTGGAQGNAATSALIGTVQADGRWHRVGGYLTPDYGDRTGVYFYARLYGATADGQGWYLDGFQVEQGRKYNTSYCDGDQGDGYSWSGTAHASASSRTVTTLRPDAAAALIQGNNTVSFRCVAQAAYDYDDANQPTFQMLADISDGTVNNRLAWYYRAGVQKIHFRINTGGAGIQDTTGSVTFSAGDWLDLVATLDLDNNTVRLYKDGVEIGSNTGITYDMPSSLNSWRVGSNLFNGELWNGTIAEFAAFDKALTAAEVAQLYNLQRPLVDAGAIRWQPTAPGPSWGELHIYNGVDSPGFDDSGSWAEAGNSVFDGLFRFSFAGAHVSGLVQFECFARAIGSSAKARLYNVTDSIAVPGSELSWSSGEIATKRSAPLAFALGEKQYCVQVKIDTPGGGNSIESYMARLIISPGLSTL